MRSYLTLHPAATVPVSRIPHPFPQASRSGEGAARAAPLLRSWTPGDRTELGLLPSAEDDHGRCGRLRLSHTPSPTVGTVPCAGLRVTATSLSRAAETVATACHSVRSHASRQVLACPTKRHRLWIGSALHRPFPVFLESWGRAAGALKRLPQRDRIRCTVEGSQ